MNMHLLTNKKTQINAQTVISNDEFSDFQRLKAFAIALGLNAKPLTKGQLIRLRRAQEGLTIAQLAKKARLDRGHLAKIEEDATSVQDSTIDKLEKVFGKEFSSLLKIL